MRIVLTTPLLLLAACNPSAQEQKTEPAQATAAASAAASETVSYACDNGKKATAVYTQTDEKTSKDGATEASKTSTVTVTIDGKSYGLNEAVSASGARYTSKDGPTQGRFFTWWTKDDALWLEGPVDKFGDLKAETVVATCKPVADAQK